MRVFFLNRFYWPNESATAQLLHDVATHLAACGHQVAVVTTDANDSGAVPRLERSAGVEVHRVCRVRRGAGLRRRAIDSLLFLAGAAWSIVRHARRGDILVAMTDPPLLGVVVTLVAGLRHARVIHWSQDIYPEIVAALASQPAVAAASKLALPLRDASWRSADRCVAISGEIAALMVHRGVPEGRIVTIPNWAPRGISPLPRSAGDPLRTAWGIGDKFVVAYSGNLGRVHDLEVIADLAEALRPARHIAVAVIGAGPGHRELMDAVASRGLDNVCFQPPQPRALLNEALAVADVHLVTLRPACVGLVFPSKTYGIAQAGRALVFVGPRTCEVARLIAEHRMGISATRDELPQLAAELIRWSGDGSAAEFGRAAANFGRKHGSVETGCAAWESLLDEF